MPRGVPKPKVPVLKISHIHDVKFMPPKNTDKYELKRLYWYLLALEKKLMIDPTSVTPQAYQSALYAYTNKVREWKNEKVKSGVDKKSLAGSNSEQSAATEVSGNGSADLGAGVPTVNPIA